MRLGVWAAARWGGGGAPALQLGIGLRCGLAIGRCDAAVLAGRF